MPERRDAAGHSRFEQMHAAPAARLDFPASICDIRLP